VSARAGRDDDTLAQRIARAGPPPDEHALFSRARAFEGARLVDVARALALDFSDDERAGRAPIPKGKVGELVERALGLARSHAAAPDLASMGIEVKTLPVDAGGRVHESTYVCRLGQEDVRDAPWARSRARKKLARVLFVLVEPAALALAERRIGRALLWSPDADEDAILEADYEDHRDLVVRGLVDLVSASRGHALQVRPKARDAATRGRGFDDDGERVRVAPRGFYLRPTFTARVLARLLSST